MRFGVVYDRLRRFVFAVEDFGGFLRFFGVGFGREGDDAGEASRDAEPSTSIPAAARKSPRRSSSPPSLILQVSVTWMDKERKFFTPKTSSQNQNILHFRDRAGSGTGNLGLAVQTKNFMLWSALPPSPIEILEG